jgi:hypothetical protein
VPLPPLLSERPPAFRLVLAVVLPVAFGVLCGVLLGVSEPAYLVFTILAILVGFGAGIEHLGGREGALRGVVGGTLFGASILVTHELTGAEAKADLPDPAALLLILTIGGGVMLGALGGRWRARRSQAQIA